MKGKVLAVVVLAVVWLALLVSGRQAQALSHSDVAIDNVFEGINSGDVEMAAAAFAEDATYENLVRKESYIGLSEIRKVLEDTVPLLKEGDARDTQPTSGFQRVLQRALYHGISWCPFTATCSKRQTPRLS